ncbi:hypothetical protein THF1C08_240080 [Vibrio jasicida]|uniref:Uncharacterized protein n=1 Tax=Vibrio jasicida TaxID=766224 RepID=A0AAU9QLK3_9VIBR|nr:hypothetical protein THF1C08_240080 [Vibrio jasicida]CAH1591785.1 hypothetical protein THF1A12_240080 [Vibrio jasicida]
MRDEFLSTSAQALWSSVSDEYASYKTENKRIGFVNCHTHNFKLLI